MQSLDQHLRQNPKAWMVGWLIFWSLLNVVTPRDASFDVLNYHILNGWSAWNGRVGTDMAAADLHSFFNPLYNMVWYPLLGLPTLIVGALIGLVHGSVLILLYVLSARVLSALGHSNRATAVMVSLFGFMSTHVIEMMSSLRMDQGITALFLLGLLSLVPADGKRVGWRSAMVAAFCVGLAFGLKLTVICYVVGIAVAIIVAMDSRAERFKAVAAAGVAGLVGIALTGGWWYFTMWQSFGNPFFPMGNSIFQAPLGPAESFRDHRMLADSLWQAVLFPFIEIVRGGGSNASAALEPKPYLLAVTYLSLPLVIAAMVYRTKIAARIGEASARVDLRPLLTVLAAAIATIILWATVFMIGRYIIAINMLGPLLLVCAVQLWRPEWLAYKHFHLMGVLVLAIVFVNKYPADLRHSQMESPFAPYLYVTPPASVDFDDHLVVFAGNFPSAFLVDGLPKSAVFTSYYVQAWQESVLENYRIQITDQLQSGTRPVVAVFNTYDDVDALLSRFADDFGLIAEQADCSRFITSADGPDAHWIACPLVRAD